MSLVTNKNVTPQKPKCWIARITDSTDTAWTTIATAPVTAPAIIRGIGACNDDAAKVLQLAIDDGVNQTLIGAMSIPANAGTNNTDPTVNLFSRTQFPQLPLDVNSQPYVFLNEGESLIGKPTAELAAGKIIHLVGFGEEFAALP